MARKADWNDTLVRVAVTTGGQQLVSLMTSFSVLQTSGLTIARLVGNLTFNTNLTVNDGFQVLDLGVGIASQESFAAGVVPDPATKDDAPMNGWLYRDRVVVQQDSVMLIKAERVAFDLRAMRKIDGSEPYLILQNSPGGGTSFTVEVTGIVRMLYLRP